MWHAGLDATREWGEDAGKNLSNNLSVDLEKALILIMALVHYWRFQLIHSQAHRMSCLRRETNRTRRTSLIIAEVSR